MALIQKLRASGIVVGAVVVALIAFVATDAIKGNGNNPAQNENIIAQVGDQEIQTDELRSLAEKNMRAELEQIPTQAEQQKRIREIRTRALQTAWQQIVSENTMEKAISNSGLVVSDVDIKEMIKGDNPMVFNQDPTFMENGQYSKSKVDQIFRQAKRDKRLKKQLYDYTQRIKKQTATQRYAGYIANTLHNTTVEKEYEYLSANVGTTGSIVAVNYSTIPDAQIKLTDDDFKSYYNNHKYLYKQKQDERDIQFVAWNVIPSSADTAMALEMAQEKIKAYAQDGESDTLGGGVTPYVSADAFNSDEFKDDTTRRNFYKAVYYSPVGTVVGPMYTEGSYLVGRKIKEIDNPDPIVNVSHILISTDEATIPNKIPLADSIAAKAKAYELLSQIKGGANFAELAKQFSADGGSGAMGGVLDPKPASNFVPGFSDFCKANGKGTVGVAKSQFGYHIIKVNENPQKTLAKLRVEQVDILPGAEITKAADGASTKFVNSLDFDDPSSFEKSQKEFKLTPRIVKDINTTTKEIIGLTDESDSRRVINWLFESKRSTGDISNVFQFRDKYIVVYVTSARNRGYAEWTDVKDKIEPEVRKELKAEKIKAKIEKHYSSGVKAEDLAKKVGGTLIPIENFKASQNFLPQLNKDDKVLGALIGTAVNKSSEPIVGVQGVAVVFVSKRDEVKVPKAGLGGNEQFDAFDDPNLVLQRINGALYNKAEVQDYRYKNEELQP